MQNYRRSHLKLNNSNILSMIICVKASTILEILKLVDIIIGCNYNVRVVCTKNMQKELSQMKYKYLLDTTTGLAGSKLHSCELCSKLFNYSSEVNKYFFL